MKVTVERTSKARITDMYVLRLPPYQQRFVAFTAVEFENRFPHIKLERGQKIVMEMDLTKI